MGIGNVGVDLGSADVGMTEERLDGAEVSTVHEEVSSERMAESVGSDMFSNASEAGVFFNHALDGARSEAAEIAILTREARVFGIIKEEGGERIMADTEVVFYPGGGRLVDENRTVFTTFAADDELAAF